MGDLRSHDLGLMSRFVKHLNTFTCYVYHEKHGKWGPVIGGGTTVYVSIILQYMPHDQYPESSH